MFNLFFIIGHQHVHGYRYPDLGFYGVFGNTEKGFYSQMLFYPFVKQFDLPAILVQIGYG